MTQQVLSIRSKGKDLTHALRASIARVQAERAGIVARELTGDELPTDDALAGVRHALDVLMSKAPIPYALTERGLAARAPVLRRIK